MHGVLKLHLPARVPSDGARQLARYVMRAHGGDLAAAARAITARSFTRALGAEPVEAVTLQRMIDGEIVPGLRVGTAMHLLFGVAARAFQRPAAGWWLAADADQRVAA